MARISITCKCNWNFFIPSTTPGYELTCPNCSELVRIPGRKPGDAVPQTAGEIALNIQRKQARVRMIIGAAAAAVVVAVVAVVMLTRSKELTDEDLHGIAPERDVLSTPRPKPPPRPPAPPPVADPVPAAPAPAALYTPAQIQEMRRSLQASVWLINMNTVLSEIFRLRNLSNEWGQCQSEVAAHEARIKQTTADLAKAGEKVALEPYLAAGDQIIGFAQQDLSVLRPGDAARILHIWVHNWRSSPALEPVTILRAGTRLELHLEFPEDTKELLTLVRHGALGAVPEPEPSAFPSVETAGVPADLLKNIESGFAALPPGYRAYLPAEDRKRLEDLIAAKRGTVEDIAWIRTRILEETIPSFQREAERIRSQLLVLEPKLAENLAVDVVVRKKDPRLEGKVLEDNEKGVKLKMRVATLTIPREDIASVEIGKGSGGEFPTRLAAAKGNLEKLVPLLAWCIEKRLTLERDYVAYTILTMDASHEKARAAVNLSRPAIGSPGPATATSKPPSADQARNNERLIEAIAHDAVSRLNSFTEVIREMKKRTESLKPPFADLPLAPAKSGPGLSVIKDPLTFEPTALTAPSSVEVGSWWSQLSAEDRKQFAKYYGHWCAVTRSRGK